MKPFWEDSKYARASYVEKAPTPALVASIEEELGYELPKSYVRMMKKHNGGIPSRSCFPTKKATTWAEDHVAIHGISAIGRKKPHSLCGALGSKFMLEEWGYPAIGVVFADCPSARGFRARSSSATTSTSSSSARNFRRAGTRPAS